MRNKLSLLCVCVLVIFALISCKKEIITCTITSPADEAIFKENQSIPVLVEASTTKGSIIQVQIFIDDDPIASLTETPYEFTIPANTIPVGIHTLAAMAYTSEGNREVAAIFITITK
jgi:hypothetical protein